MALALYLGYELHYRGFDGVDDDWEREPSLLSARHTYEAELLESLLAKVGPPVPCPDVEAALTAIVASGQGPSLSSYMADRSTLEQFQEFAIHRSAYQLKEADPHTWALPRLTGAAKAALAEIQFDEYGAGRTEGMHATLFQGTLAALGLDRR